MKALSPPRLFGVSKAVVAVLVAVGLLFASTAGVDAASSLKVGDSGPAVVEMQERLVVHGYKVVVDGDFGPKTEVKLKAFQAAKNLGVDGVAGPRTMAALRAAPSGVSLVGMRAGVYLPGEHKDHHGSVLSRYDFTAGCPELPGMVECWAQASVVQNRSWTPTDKVVGTVTLRPGEAVTFKVDQDDKCKGYYSQVKIEGRFAFDRETGVKVSASGEVLAAEVSVSEKDYVFRTETIDEFSTIDSLRNLCRNNKYAPIRRANLVN